MSKHTASDTRPGQQGAGGRKDAARRQPAARPTSEATAPSSWIPTPAGIRETVESVVVAFVLAFLFRTFEAEAFVIPTGSMAPTLMGRHKDLYCPVCGHEFQVSASDLTDRDNNTREAVVNSGTCPLCREPVDLRPGNPEHESYPTYNGDRILVAKFPYMFGEPKRWDVIVFRYPGDATTNFIKRLVGLPGETIQIHHGDLWIRDEHGTMQIARKSPQKLLAMLRPVFDNDLAPRITALGWPARWQGVPAGDGSGQWDSADGMAFENDGSAESARWLRYRHLVPSYAQWQDVLRFHAAPAGETIRPRLISDFTAYNTGTDSPLREPKCSSEGLHWVGDLALECTLDVQSDAGEVIFELVKGGRRFQCRFDVADGTATLGVPGPGAADFRPQARTAVRGPGRHTVMFANVDDELRLWVDGRVTEFDAATTYDSFVLGARIPTEADLSPAGIAVRKAAAKVSHLKLSRDIYYIADEMQREDLNDFKRDQPELGDPDTWPLGFADANMRRLEFPLAPADPAHPEQDRFLVLGDNSASSKDCRLWWVDHIDRWVPRKLLIGKALYIYWPHSWDEVPYLRIPLYYFPNFKRMHLVR